MNGKVAGFCSGAAIGMRSTSRPASGYWADAAANLAAGTGRLT
jgi:hypothetical protein